MKDFFSMLRWYDLIPDQAHVVVTSGYCDIWLSWHRRVFG
jgi:hypothetical protein